MMTLGKATQSFSLSFLCFSLCLLPFGYAYGIFGTFSHLITGFDSAYREFCKVPEAAFMSTPLLINYHGYPVEEHKVLTKDGYTVTLFRIPYGKSPRLGSRKKEPVLMYHGLLSSSDDWLLLPDPEDNLPYLLANDGHDVWLGNVRGNKYSLDDTNRGVSSNDSKYYDFSYDELAQFDVPAVIRYVLRVNKGSPQLSYVGYSLGSTILFMALDVEPQLNSLIRKTSVMAPSAYFTNMKSPLFLTLHRIPKPLIKAYIEILGHGQIIPGDINDLLTQTDPLICNGEIPKELCYNFIFLIGGYDRDQLTNATVTLVVGHSPSVFGAKVLLHADQILSTAEFRHYDNGPEENLQIYGVEKSPFYNLSNYKVPTQGFFAENDLVIVPEDALHTLKELGGPVQTIKVKHENWTHTDYVYGKDAKFYVYDKIVQFLGS